MSQSDKETYSVGVLNVSPADNLANVTHCYTPTPSEIVAYQASVRNLNSWLKIDVQTFAMFERACNKFAQTVQQIRDAFENPPRPTVDQAIFEINADFLGLLNFLRTYLDYAETMHHKGLSNDEKEKTLYKRLTSEQFDTRFAYRFCSKLRNFSQHCGFPINGFNAEGRLVPGSKKQSYTFELYFQRNYLLESYDSWGKILKPELQKMPERIDVMKIVEELYTSVSDLRAGLLKDVVVRLQPDYDVVKQLLKYTQGHPGTPLLMRIFDENTIAGGKEMKIEQSPMPVEILLLIDEINKQVK